MQEWGTDDEPPLGYTKRLLHVVVFKMPALREAEMRKFQNMLQKFVNFPGILCSFDRIGSRGLDKDSLSKDAWPDIMQCSQDMSHVLTVVADSTDALKAVLTSEAYCREWSASLAPHARKSVSFTSPLGLDLVHAKKRDPMLVMHGLQLKEVKEDSDEYGKMMKAIEAISKLPGIDGKIAVSFQPLGSGRYSHEDLLEQLDVKENRAAGITHCFAVLVDEPASYKMLAQSKTYGKWKASYEPYLAGKVLAFCMPVDIAATASAPKDVPKTKQTNGVKK